MEFLKDDGLVFCSFFDIKEISVNKNASKENKKGSVYLSDTKENEKIMILYAKEKLQKTPA
ncbi:hypothetical protein LS70_002055 [Helicobacter sp. MIT 11-5569]|uniref:hypothetical protein n=1 Tax=Helicobacter sp. MIT 11-5569 TaxID=1548151 RepID=UPI00051FB00A|nr:hypothetical protein [Helicobacter sp. MIT 11-5569]TLD85350.1 hypothetical protein LS70_002055 [Helicobacter sp. MIT 11-5569]